MLFVLGMVSYTFTSCSTLAGRGATAGAVGGAVVAGPVGAAVGAAGGALVGAAVGEAEVARYGAAPAAGYPVASSAGKPGMVYSPYTGRLYDVRNVPSRGLVLDTDVNKLFVALKAVRAVESEWAASERNAALLIARPSINCDVMTFVRRSHQWSARLAFRDEDEPGLVLCI